jgi:hypothetical protein
MKERNKALRKYLEIEHPPGEIRYFITVGPTDYLDFICSECGERCLVKFYGNVNDAMMCEIQIECSNCNNKLKFPYKCETLEDYSKE